MAQRLNRIKWIDEAVPTSGPRHELRDTFGSLGADSLRVEAAFLPDHPSKELDGKGILRGRLL
jgi:hypothetical protein